MQIYLVGGAVRDQLLNYPVQERDWVVVGATPQEMIARGYKPVGKDFPVFLDPQSHEEYALARTERKTGPGYTGFSFHAARDVTLEDDLKRRDLTINAMAQDEQGHLIDPYGGQQDLQARVLRHVSPAFIEDPVRILRVARFMARYAHLGFTIAHETLQLMKTMVQNGEVNFLVPERVWQEVERGLLEKNPEQFFLVLRECGALAILFPELDKLFGVPQSPVMHPEVDTGIHVMMVLAQAARLTEDGSIRFAALTHDVGKSLTPKEEWPRHPGHEKTGVALIKEMCARLRIPKNHRDLALVTCEWHGQCHRAFELTAEELLAVLEALDAFRRPERLQKFLIACEADSRGRTGFEDQPYPQSAYLQALYQATAQVSVQSLVAAGLSGNEIARELKVLRMEAIATFIENNKDKFLNS